MKALLVVAVLLILAASTGCVPLPRLNKAPPTTTAYDSQPSATYSPSPTTSSPLPTTSVPVLPTTTTPPATLRAYGPGATSPPGPLVPSQNLTLEWSQAPGAEYYKIRIERWLSAGYWFPANPNNVEIYVAASFTSKKVTPGLLLPGTCYRWCYYFYGRGGNSPMSELFYFQTLP